MKSDRTKSSECAPGGENPTSADAEASFEARTGERSITARAQAIADATDGSERSSANENVKKQEGTGLGPSLDAQVETRNLLIGMAVHDLKNPLSVITVVASLLLKRARLRPVDTESVKQILWSADVMRRMIADLLDVNAKSIEPLKPSRREFALGALVASVAHSMDAVLAAKRQKVSISGAVDQTIGGDPDLIRRVFQNLIDNCRKYAPDGGEITVEITRSRTNTLEVRVTDSGPGIPDAYKERIFDPYVQIDPENGNRTGHGLGLAFCRMAVEAHRGRIWVEDGRKGSGSCFRVCLPVAAKE